VPVTSGEEVGQALLTAVEAFRGVSPVEDDESVVVLQRCAPLIDEAWPR